MRVALVLPRHMHFSPQGATSIDLCAYELALHSKYKATTQVICAEENEYFPGLTVTPFSQKGNSFRRILHMNKIIKAFNPDVIVIHQHLRSTFLLSLLNPKTPVIFWRHNYSPIKLNWLSRLVYHLYWKQIYAVFFVSESCREGFISHSAYMRHRTFVMYNALDLSNWRPWPVKEKEIVFAGRCTPEKGALEGARAAVLAILDRPEWRVTLYLAQPQKDPAYLALIQASLRPLGARARIVTDAPFAEVKTAFERAAIALVPSIWREPFGRTAIEAMAGGAALISSGKGGLLEVIGPPEACAALQVEPRVEDIQTALEKLLDDEALRLRTAAAGCRRVNELFSVKKIAALYDKHLEVLRGS